MRVPWVSAKEWQERTAPELGALDDPVWRLANLYEIQEATDDAETGVVFWPFVPKPEQRVLIWDIHVRRVKNLIVPKARKLGCSTALMLVGFDLALWNAGFDTLLVDKTLIDAREKLQKMVRVAWEKLPAEIRAMFTASLAEEKFVFHRNGAVADAASQVRISVSGRGGSPNFLLVSEWGTIQFDEPKRSEEIKTGAMPAAEFGIRVIETTWKGADDGDVWPYVANALKVPDDKKGPKDWRLRFFPWWLEPKYSYAGDPSSVSAAVTAYLAAMAAEISAELGEPFEFSPGQALFYQHQSEILGIYVKREYPTVLRECWEAPVEGAIYAAHFAEALADGRVRAELYDPALPVFTSWDIGGPANLVVWYFQVTRGRVRWIDCDIGLDLTTKQRVDHMHAKNYRFARHLLPHDAASTGASAISFENDLRAHGLENVVVVQRTSDEWLGINAVLQLFQHFEFDADKTTRGVRSLKAFHVHEKTKEPVADWSKHACDAMRTMAEGAKEGLISLEAVELPGYEHLRYFDGATLAHYEAREVSWRPRLKTGVIEHDVWVERPLASGAWLRQWEAAYPGSRYLLTAVPPRVHGEGWAVGVWRAHPVGEGTATGAAPVLAAAFMGGLVVDKDRASAWVSALSRFYGRCLVVPVINDIEGFAELLLADKAGPLWTREEPLENQPVGRGRINRKVGFKLTPQATAQMLGVLRGRLRERSLECAALEVVRQLETFVQMRPDEPAGPLPGHGQAWVLMAGLAALCIERATLFAVEDWQEGVDARRARGHYVEETASAADVEG